MRNQVAKNNGKVLTTKQAAEFYGLSTQWFEGKRHRGGGPRFISFGHVVRYRLEDLEKFLEEHRREHTSDDGNGEAN